MRFDIDYEILGTMVTLVIAYNFKMNYVTRTRSDNAFIKMVYFILGSQILDMVSAYTICLEKPELNILNHILTSGYFLCAFATSIAFERYIITYIPELGRNRVYDIIRKALIVVYTVFSLLNPFTGLAFYFDEEGKYYHGTLYVIGYIAPAVFLLTSLFLIVHFRKRFAKKQWVSSVVFLLIVFGAMLLQFIVFNDVYLTFGFIPVALLMVLFSLETPDYRKLMKTLEELEKAKQEALSANQIKSAFLANMSHEIRTPINSVLGFNEMILRETGEEEIFSYASNIKLSGQALLSLVNDILDLSRIEAGKMEIVSTEYDTKASLTGLLRMIMLQARDKGLKLKYDIDRNTPKRLYGDEMRILQILTNLLTNAVKYTDKGEVELEVKVKERREDKVRLYFAVKDTGMGIEEENIEKLFSEFSRIENKAHKIEGTGLGLPITVKCLKLMNSRLEVESTSGKGSRFWFFLEQKVVDPTPIGEIDGHALDTRPEVEVFKEGFVSPDARILVVDDVELNLKVFKGLLKTSKMRIDTAVSGFEAIELLKRNSYDIVFMDHQMPDMDGIETLEKIREENIVNMNTVPFIALTANAISGARKLYIEKGFSDYLTKPIEGKNLSEILYKWLPSRKVVQTEKPVYKAEEKCGDRVVSELDKLGIDIKAGIGYAMGDVEFYKELVMDFASGMESAVTELKSYLAAGDYKTYGIKVHSLKSTARTIGVKSLSDKAKVLEEAAKNSDISFIAANNDILCSEYEALAGKIKRLV